ncbi:unnamed protein product [Caretta caretta]
MLVLPPTPKRRVSLGQTWGLIHSPLNWRLFTGSGPTVLRDSKLSSMRTIEKSKKPMTLRQLAEQEAEVPGSVPLVFGKGRARLVTTIHCISALLVEDHSNKVLSNISSEVSVPKALILSFFTLDKPSRWERMH